MLLSAFTVNSLGDTGTGSGTSGDLLYCITQADQTAGNTISFGVDGMILLTSALPALSKNMTISGPGASSLTVEGGGSSSNFSVLTVKSGVTAKISGLTIANGHSTFGGGVDNGGTLSVTDCTIAGDSATTGGAISNGGTVTLNDCTLSNDLATGHGGGIFSGGTLTIINSTISGDSVTGDGGGISNTGSLTLINSTLSGDSATDYGGGISNIGPLTLTNCTVFGNFAPGGGGISNTGPLTLNNTIVAGNFRRAPPNTTADDISTSVEASASFNNLIGTGGSGGLVNGANGNLVGVADPGLGTLGDYGGPTQTIPLLPGSPAIDAGNNAKAVDAGGNPLATDQRGDPRFVNGTIDIGAVELSLTLTAAGSASVTFSLASLTVSLGATVTGAAGTVNGGTVTFTILSGTTILGSAVMVNVANGTADANYSLPADTSAGTYTIQAVYSGTADYGGSTDTSQTLIISPAPSATTAASASGTFSTSDQTVTLSATVTSTAGVVDEGTETFTILLDGVVIGSPVMANVQLGEATARYELPPGLSAGTYIIEAVYNGSTDFLGYADENGALIINPAATATSASNATATSGDASVTLTATVTSAAGTVDQGKETFTILNGTTVVGSAVTVNVESGTASAEYAPPADMKTGKYTIRAVYNGTADFLVSTGTSQLTVGAGQAFKVVFGQQPTGAIAGTAISPAVTVMVEDQNQNVVTTDSSMVTLTLTGGTFGSGSSTVAAMAAKGVAMFSDLEIDLAGPYTLSATDGNLVPSGASKSFTISPAAVDRFLVTTSFASPDIAGTGGTVTVTAKDAYGNTVGNGPNQYEGTVDFSGTDNQIAGLPSDYTFTAADAGSHTFADAALKTAGNQTITATDSVTGTMTGGVAVDVVPAAASQMVITSSPLTLIAGSREQVTARLEDAYSNLGATPATNQTIRLTTTSTAGTFYATQSGTASITGVVITTGQSGVSFYYSDTKAGAPTVTVSDGAFGSSLSQVQTVDPAAARAFMVTTSLANPDVAGAAGTVTVTAKDAYGNTVGNGPNQYEGTVDLSGTDAQTVGLPASHTFSATDAGSYTFTGVAPRTAGTQTLTAADSANPGFAGTDAVKVIPAGAEELVVTTQPPNTVIAGHDFGMAVSVEDSYHNVDTDFNGDVTIALPGDPALTTTVSARNGVATFSGLSITTVGPVGGIKATSGNLGAGTSNPFTVIAAPPVNPNTSPPMIERYQVSTTRKLKKGKKGGKPVFGGFRFAFNMPVVISNATIDVYSTVKPHGKKKTGNTLKPVSVTPSYDPSTNSVVLNLTSTKPFATAGGEITISGVTSQAGTPQSPAEVTFVITKNAKTIQP